MHFSHNRIGFNHYVITSYQKQRNNEIGIGPLRAPRFGLICSHYDVQKEKKIMKAESHLPEHLDCESSLAH